jgi:hypothetical protein
MKDKNGKCRKHEWITWSTNNSSHVCASCGVKGQQKIVDTPNGSCMKIIANPKN